jgi:GntR family transcriptional regulator/MocR family aminotransferase
MQHQLGDAITVDPPDQGMHLVAYLRRGLSDTAIERAARSHDVIVRAMSGLYVDARARSALVLGFSGYPPQVIAPAVARLAKAIEQLQQPQQKPRRTG